MSVCECVHIYVYMDMYKCIHIYICLYTYIHILRQVLLKAIENCLFIISNCNFLRLLTILLVSEFDNDQNYGQKWLSRRYGTIPLPPRSLHKKNKKKT